MSKWFSVFVFPIALFIQAVPAQASQSIEKLPVIISAVKLGGSVVPKEYVELHNNDDTDITFQKLILEYSKFPSSDVAQTCKTSEWSTDENRTKQTILTNLLIEAKGSVRIEVSGLLDTATGAVRIIEIQGAEQAEEMFVHDVVGWGEGDAKPVCQETTYAQTPKNDEVLTRCMAEGLAVDTSDNSKDFAAVKAENYSLSPCSVAAPETNCKSVAITEILSNPKTDAGNEFIEIYNPTNSSILLHGCGLIADSKEYMFPTNIELAAGEHKAFYDSETGIRLTNSKSVEVALISGGIEYPATAYPADMGDDVSWALINGVWQETDNPTPNAPNQPMSPGEVGGSGGGDKELASCPSGKFRNPLTNRCKSIAFATAALTPCKPGQARNPETNRCRSTALASATLTPCKPGQERNLATNRCRSVLSASSSLKPCDEGEERNPETNRCRKIASPLSGAKSEDKENQGKSKVNYAILGMVGASALGYGAYEYRNDFRNKFFSLKSRFFPDKSGE